ncbi:MAG TPA: terminase family protein [Allosphingosinicella sp.]|nr:terminase family protein [Allosphingosinicella sp.]
MRLPPEARLRAYLALPPPLLRAVDGEWWWQAHGGQVEPAAAADGAPWRVWALVAARGFGKTRAGAEWVWARAREDREARIALVAASVEEAVKYMIKGESGLLDVARCDEEPRWIASHSTLYFPSGAMAYPYGAVGPEALRGAQHHYAWCDELAKWPNADATWDNLMLGLRLGQRPRTIVTTTPKPMPLLRRILALPRCVSTPGRTDDNPHSAPDFRAAVREMYAGTRLGRQELEGLLLDEFEGALWTRELLEKARGKPLPSMGEGWEGVDGAARAGLESSPHSQSLPGEGRDEFVRVVVGVDPPASTGGDSCGILVCGKDGDGVAWVLADLTAHGLSPEAWARRVADAAALYGAGKVVAEKNQGGDMIASVLRAVDADLPVGLVAATKSKAARAEPIALRFETGRARLAGRFPELEDQLCALTWSGYQGQGSPDRADAMIWAMTELFEKEPRTVRIRRL